MIRYIFCMTGCSHWATVAKQMSDRKIAKPVIWLGDDVHFDWAKRHFGDGVLRMNDHVHYPASSMGDEKISLQDSSFFGSEQYLRAKDRCLKMMDRLDTFGMFSRIDREVFFNQLCVIYISTVEKFSPTHIVMTEAPHSHAQYLLYEISLFLGLKVAWFNNWMIGPVMCLQDMETMKYVQTSKGYSSNIPPQFVDLIGQFINNVEQKWEGEFEYSYMLSQAKASTLINRAASYLRYDILRVLKNSYHTVTRRYLGVYDPINPFYLNFLVREKMKSRRRAALKKFSVKSTKDTLKGGKYVYFALHFEPERTTNPDGGIFHDQFIAIQRLRQLLPADIEIIVKEHPSQFLMAERGPKGRSPLFYKMLKSLEGITLIDPSFDSMSLQRNCEFVATITGSVAIENAIIGKPAIIFGNAWFKGCPNIVAWEDISSYESLVSRETANRDEIERYLTKMFMRSCIVANQNISAQSRNIEFLSEEFDVLQVLGAVDLMSSFFSQSKG